MSTAFSSALVDTIGGITIVIGAVIYMAVVDMVLLLVVVVVVGLSIGIIAAASSRIGSLSQTVQDHLSRLGEIFQNSLSVIRTIKSLRAERTVVGLLDQEITSCYQARKKMNVVEAILMPLSTLTGYVALIVMLVVGAIRVSRGAISTEQLVVFATALFIVMAPIGQVSVAFSSFFEAKGAMVRIKELFTLPIEDIEPTRGSVDKHKAPIAAAFPFEFRSVSYGFRDAQVLSDTNLDVRAGEKVALMGPSGSGKSTMLSLPLRFYQPTSGTILVDGATIADQSLFDLRGTVAYVEQEPNLLPGTLKENLLLGVAEPPTDSELIELLRQCGLFDFASQSGLRREVGAANSGVSGGERQRIAIIRAIVQKAPIIVVDEPTSALDTNTAITVMSLLMDIPATVVYSTHDRQVARLADRSLSIADGRIVPTPDDS